MERGMEYGMERETVKKIAKINFDLKRKRTLALTCSACVYCCTQRVENGSGV